MKVLALAAFALPVLAAAKLSAQYTYYGVNRPFEISASAGEIRLYSTKQSEPLASAMINGGKTDLAKVLKIWSIKSVGVLYLQEFQQGRPVGAALVLQPMTNPAISTLAPDGRNVVFTPDEDSANSGFRVWRDQDAEFDTSLGKIRVRMRPDAAPNTVWNFLKLVEGGFYRDVIFHRVVAKRPDGTAFVIQGGDPTGTGSGAPGYAFPLEKSPLPHDFGVISMARSTDPNTNGCQFFFALSREGTKHLDDRYASFGETISGGATILKIAAVKTGEQDRPLEPPVIRRIRLVDAAPYGTGPMPEKKPQ
ncbi:MAG: peptidylprolyl isomerase [Chthonomonas sp.]|nr:peptidylprolyl isomerase [Chthonomonas sp.]